VTGGIDPIYLALTPQASGPTGFTNPLWVDNSSFLRSEKIFLQNGTTGGVSNPILTLNNTYGATGATAGFPSVETSKTGKNAATGDIIYSQSHYANNYVGTKTEFARIEASVRATGLNNDDGALAFLCATQSSGVNVFQEFFRLNGNDNENNSFRPLDMNGNNIRTSTGNLTITTAGATGGNLTLTTVGATGAGELTISSKGNAAITTGTGNISMTSGANITGTALGIALNAIGSGGDSVTLTSAGNINLIPAVTGATGSSIKTDSNITTLTGTGGSIIDFAGGNPDDRFDIDNDAIRLHWNNLTDQADISLTNDYATANSVIDMVYQSSVGNLQTYLQNTPSIQTFKQIDSINGRTSEIRPDKIELGNSSSTTALINNNLGSNQNEFILSATNSFSLLSTSARMINTPTGQAINLVNSDGTSNTKTLSLLNETATGGSLTYSNAIDTNPFTISSTEDLNISSGNDIEISSANDIDILATAGGMGTRSVNITANGSGGINLTTLSSLTMNINNDLIFTGSSIINSSAGGSSGQHLRIFINGTPYKIQLLND
jgi:hypothetical protein